MYMALYRQWRPKSFADIVGQEHVRQTLTYALAQNKVAHAYLFSGPRGTGKTTVARLLAKSLNCRDRQGTEPCKLCVSCAEIDQGVSMDVVEIDAASNRGIDEIRDLREKVRLASAGGGYKVYIIDEVHMLTAEAFNALLKTLEDPPQGVVFILATTEAHRVPATILSRVQHFEFRRIALGDIEEHLGGVCEALEREVDHEALHVIALKCEGSLRDALSMLDQCLSRDGRISREDILRQLGMMGEGGSSDLVDGLLRNDYAGVLQRMDEHMAAGRDPRQMLRELLDYLRDMMICLAGGGLSPRAPEVLRLLGSQAKEAGMERVLAWIHLLLQGEADLKFAPNARLAVEMLLVQAVYGAEEDEPGSEEKASRQKRTDEAASREKRDRKREGIQDRKEAVKKAAPAQKEVSVPREEPSGKRGSSAKSLQDDSLEKKAVARGDRPPDLTEELWEKIVLLIRQRSKPVHAFILSGEPALSGGKLQLVFPRSHAFNCDMINQEMHKKVLESAVREVMGCDLPVEGTVASVPVPSGSRTAAPRPEAQAKAKVQPQADVTAKQDCAAQDAVEKAVEIFGSGVVVVREDND